MGNKGETTVRGKDIRGGIGLLLLLLLLLLLPSPLLLLYILPDQPGVPDGIKVPLFAFDRQHLLTPPDR